MYVINLVSDKAIRLMDRCMDKESLSNFPSIVSLEHLSIEGLYLVIRLSIPTGTV